jgi:hypothetical protein
VAPALAGLPGGAVDRGERGGPADRCPRPGRPAAIQAEPVCPIHRLAGAAPGQAGRPISQWRRREIADEIIRRGILPASSPRHAARIVNRGL